MSSRLFVRLSEVYWSSTSKEPSECLGVFGALGLSVIMGEEGRLDRMRERERLA